MVYLFLTTSNNKKRTCAKKIVKIGYTSPHPIEKINPIIKTGRSPYKYENVLLNASDPYFSNSSSLSFS